MNLSSPIITLQAGAALAPYLRVYLASGVLQLAGADRVGDGVVHDRGYASGDKASVVAANNMGVMKMTAAAAITQYADVYAAASGKITSSTGGKYIGMALEAASGDGSVIEVLRLPNGNGAGNRVVEAHTAGDTLTAAESGSVHTSVGASGAITLVLPPATVGLSFMFRVGAAQELRIDPDTTETIALPSTGVAGAAGKYLTADADGETVHLVCTKAGTWSCMGFTGTWTAEA